MQADLSLHCFHILYGLLVNQLVLCLRSFGGEVSWHESVAAGATYPETDETITHQIVDRPNMDKQYLSRYVDLSNLLGDLNCCP